MKQRYGFFYLKTGGGHYSGAKSICEKLKTLNPEANYSMCDGLENCPKFFRLVFEDGYSHSQNYFPLGYMFFYHLSNIQFLQNLLYKWLAPFVKINLRRKIVKEKFTKIVSTHEILTSILRTVCDDLNMDIPIIQVVMDPFTAHSTWFLEKNVKLVVLSSYSKKLAIEKYNFKEEDVFLASPIFSEKFNKKLSDAEKLKVKKSLNLPENKKILLIVGGGEGLKTADKILKEFLKNNFTEQIIIVCGKNRNLKRKLESIVKKQGAKNVLILGFVSIMYELINIADCVVSKAGPGTVMEILSMEKPLIICSFIRYQEYGNVFFVKQNNAGFFIPEPKEIYNKVHELFTDANFIEKKSCVKIENGITKIAKYIESL